MNYSHIQSTAKVDLYNLMNIQDMPSGTTVSDIWKTVPVDTECSKNYIRNEPIFWNGKTKFSLIFFLASESS